jgi:uncharacterized protein YodC (DUF2158 family)
MKVGDVVVLNSGGPRMVINEINKGTDYINCTWFDDDNLPHSASFHQAMVKFPLAEEPAKSDRWFIGGKL